MNAITKSFRECTEILKLYARQVRTIKRAQGTCVQCVGGSVWVTLENNPLDFVLSPGERVCINVPGRMVVEGLELSEVKITQAHPATSRTLARLLANMASIPRAWGLLAALFHNLTRSHRCPIKYAVDSVTTYHGSFRL